MSQLDNNVIITGIQEGPWEDFNVTYQCVHDIITSSLSSEGTPSTEAIEEAKKIQIVSCKQLGKFQMNKSCPITTTFQYKEDKENLMAGKKNLPRGIYVNHKYLIHVKQNRDLLRSILRLAKSLPEYKDKSCLEGDRLIINGIGHTVNNLGHLPEPLAAYKAA